MCVYACGSSHSLSVNCTLKQMENSKNFLKRNRCHSYLVFCYRKFVKCLQTLRTTRSVCLCVCFHCFICHVIDGQKYECEASTHVIAKDYCCWFIAVFITKRNTVDCTAELISSFNWKVLVRLFFRMFVTLFACCEIFLKKKKISRKISFLCNAETFRKISKVREEKFSWQTYCSLLIASWWKQQQ